MVGFTLLPVAYALVRRRAVGLSSFALPGVFVPLALAIAVFNAVLLMYGGAQWGAKVVGIGVVLVLTCLPLYVWRRERGAMVGDAGEHAD